MTTKIKTIKQLKQAFRTAAGALLVLYGYELLESVSDPAVAEEMDLHGLSNDMIVWSYGLRARVREIKEKHENEHAH